MIDFIVEHIWIFVIVGAIIILTIIGYIVDKFVINKDNKEIKEVKEKDNDEVEEQVNLDDIQNETNEAIQESTNEEIINPEVPDDSDAVVENQNSEIVPIQEEVNETTLNSNEEKSDNKKTPWEV